MKQRRKKKEKYLAIYIYSDVLPFVMESELTPEGGGCGSDNDVAWGFSDA